MDSSIYLRRKATQNSACIASVIAGTVFFVFLMISNIGHGSSLHFSASTITPFNKSRCKIEPLDSISQFYKYIDNPVVKCKRAEAVGGRYYKEFGGYFEGEKYVCFDSRFHIQPTTCTVLSFGIKREYSFEDGMERFGCKGFVFIPSSGVKDHWRSPNIQVFSTGLSSFTGNIPNVGKVDRYENILKNLDLFDKHIDYLRVDIDMSELPFLNDVFSTNPELLKNVKQIGMEIHPGTYSGQDIRRLPLYQAFWKYISYLRCLGFDLMFAHNNNITALSFEWEGKQRSSVLELVWAQNRKW